MITNLKNKLKFIELLDKMNEIKRVITLKNGDMESDAEHSFHLAMMVSVFLPDFPKLSELKTIKIALFHDLVEIFAWDTVLFDEEMTKTKKQREAKAVIELEKVLWEKDFADFKTLILEYENKSSIEAEFVYELDKLQPIIKIITEWWNDFHTLKMDKNKIMKDKLEKIGDKFWFRQILRKYEKIGDENNMFYFDK